MFADANLRDVLQAGPDRGLGHVGPVRADAVDVPEDALRERARGRVADAPELRRDGLHLLVGGQDGLLCNGTEVLDQPHLRFRHKLHLAHAEQHLRQRAPHRNNGQLHTKRRMRKLETRRHGLHLGGLLRPLYALLQQLLVILREHVDQGLLVHGPAEETILPKAGLENATVHAQPQSDVARQPRHGLQSARHKLALGHLLRRLPLAPQQDLVPAGAHVREHTQARDDQARSRRRIGHG
mmetsp:Transcript_25369/g.73201  ORF Transcript_25369/g.73201 Transcript_25369/m.73201 type:complete len:239 (+) Transcript_25369:1311-2027(+)